MTCADGAGQPVFAAVTGDQSGHTKVKQLYRTARVNEDISRFEVTVNNKLSVRILDRRADLQEQL
jgi:hypothetical protein